MAIDEAHELWLWESSEAVPPAMSILLRDSEQTGHPQVLQLVDRWGEIVRNAQSVVVVGASPRPEEERIWGPLSETPAVLVYVGDRGAFNRWVASHRRHGPSEFAGTTFEQAFETVVGALLRSRAPAVDPSDRPVVRVPVTSYPGSGTPRLRAPSAPRRSPSGGVWRGHLTRTSPARAGGGPGIPVPGAATSGVLGVRVPPRGGRRRRPGPGPEAQRRGRRAGGHPANPIRRRGAAELGPVGGEAEVPPRGGQERLAGHGVVAVEGPGLAPLARAVAAVGAEQGEDDDDRGQHSWQVVVEGRARIRPP